MTISVTPTAPALYILDANVFIEAAKRYYAFDLAPKFWDGLLKYANAGRLCTIDRIAAEIASPVPLNDWMTTSFSGFVKASGTPATLIHYGALMQWAQSQPFLPAAKSEFATVADAWLVAYAKGVGGTLVTHEKFDANCRSRVKIPNACHHVGVQYVDTFEMIRALGMKIG